MFCSNSVGKSSYFPSSAWEIVTTIIFSAAKYLSYFINNIVVIEPTLLNMNSSDSLIIPLIVVCLFVCFLCRLPLPSKSADWTHFGGKHSHSQKELLWGGQEEHYLAMTAALSRAPYWHEWHVEMFPGWGSSERDLFNPRFSPSRVNRFAPTFKWFPFQDISVPFPAIELLPTAAKVQLCRAAAENGTDDPCVVVVSFGYLSLQPMSPDRQADTVVLFGLCPAQTSTQNWNHEGSSWDFLLTCIVNKQSKYSK